MSYGAFNGNRCGRLTVELIKPYTVQLPRANERVDSYTSGSNSGNRPWQCHSAFPFDPILVRRFIYPIHRHGGIHPIGMYLTPFVNGRFCDSSGQLRLRAASVIVKNVRLEYSRFLSVPLTVPSTCRRQLIFPSCSCVDS